MAKGILVVQSGPSDPSREDEFNEWYSKTHIPEVLAVPGFVGARRYKVRDGGRRAAGSAPPYATVYEIEADDLDAAMGQLSAHAADGRVGVSDMMQLDPPPVVTLYELVD